MVEPDIPVKARVILEQAQLLSVKLECEEVLQVAIRVVVLRQHIMEVVVVVLLAVTVIPLMVGIVKELETLHKATLF